MLIFFFNIIDIKIYYFVYTQTETGSREPVSRRLIILGTVCHYVNYVRRSCKIMPVLQQRFCSSLVAVMWQFCSSFVAVLQQFCSSFVAILQQFYSSSYKYVPNRTMSVLYCQRSVNYFQVGHVFFLCVSRRICQHTVLHL